MQDVNLRNESKELYLSPVHAVQLLIIFIEKKKDLLNRYLLLFCMIRHFRI